SRPASSREAFHEPPLLTPEPGRRTRGRVRRRAFWSPRRRNDGVDALVRERPLEEGLRPGLDSELAQRLELRRRRLATDERSLSERAHRDDLHSELRGERQKLALALPL